MQGYVVVHKKKTPLGRTLTLVAIIHVIIGGGLVWLATTQEGRELMTVYKMNIMNLYEPPPPPPQEVKALEPEPPPPLEAEEPEPPKTLEPEPPIQEAKAPEPPSPSNGPPIENVPSMGQSSPQVKLPAFGNSSFAYSFGDGGKKGKFRGYADLITVEIQRLYKQPPDLPEDNNLFVQFQVVLDSEGNVLNYRIVRPSGNVKFDQSALQAISKLQHVRPPPERMSRTLVVKFFHRVVSD